jgi:hypothetical protein
MESRLTLVQSLTAQEAGREARFPRVGDPDVGRGASRFNLTLLVGN